MIYLLSLYEIMFYFIFVHNYIWILDKAFNIDFCLFNFVVVYYFLVHSLNSGGVRVKHDLIGCLYMFSVTWSIAIARLVFSSWSCMRRSVYSSMHCPYWILTDCKFFLFLFIYVFFLQTFTPRVNSKWLTPHTHTPSDSYLKLDLRICNPLLLHCICIMDRKHRIGRIAVELLEI